MVFPSEEPPFIDGVVFDPAPAIIQALKWKHQSIEKLAIKQKKGKNHWQVHVTCWRPVSTYN